MKIKEASEEDIKEIAKVYVESWKTTYSGLVPEDYLNELSYKEAEQKWLNFLNAENDPIMYIAISEENNIVGFASGKSIDDEIYGGELYALYVLEEYKGYGAGRQLVSFIAKHFKELGITSIMVWAMEQNKSGLGFYERMGGNKYIRRESEFGGMVVNDVAYGWKDVSVLCM